MTNKDKEVKKITDSLSSLQETSQKDGEAFTAAQQHFNAVSAGLSSNEDGEEASLAEQMMACKKDISKAETEAKQVLGTVNLFTSYVCFVRCTCLLLQILEALLHI